MSDTDDRDIPQWMHGGAGHDISRRSPTAPGSLSHLQGLWSVRTTIPRATGAITSSAAIVLTMESESIGVIPALAFQTQCWRQVGLLDGNCVVVVPTA